VKVDEANRFSGVVFERESPQSQPLFEVADRAESEQEILGRAERDVSVRHLSLEDLRLLLLSGHHSRQQFLHQQQSL